MTEAFAGFRPAALAFLSELRENNEPVWFKPRKAVYEAELLEPLKALVAAVGAALAAHGVPLVGDPRRGVFRIYRDVRFSPDKRPYKTHAAAVLSRSGGRHDPGVLYIHIAPGDARAGAGFWHPEPQLLARLRRSLVDDADGFLAMAADLAAAGCAIVSDDKLSRLPRGFEDLRGDALADYVCWKSFTASAPLADAEVMSPILVDRVVAFADAVLPLLEWGWAAVDGDLPPVTPVRLPRRPLPTPDF